MWLEVHSPCLIRFLVTDFKEIQLLSETYAQNELVTLEQFTALGAKLINDYMISVLIRAKQCMLKEF